MRPHYVACLTKKRSTKALVAGMPKSIRATLDNERNAFSFFLKAWVTIHGIVIRVAFFLDFLNREKFSQLENFFVEKKKISRQK